MIGVLTDAAYSIARRLPRYFGSSSSRDVWKYRSLRYASSLQICVTNICNAKCVFCGYRLGKDEKGIMDMRTFQQAIYQWKDINGGMLDLTPTVGDPLIDEQLFDKIDLANYWSSGVVLTTNGILLKRGERWRKLIDCLPKKVFLSIPTFDRDWYAKSYGVDRAYDVLEGVHHLLLYNKRMREPVEIRMRFRNPVPPSEILKSSDYRLYIEPFLSKRVTVSFTPDFDNWGGAIRESDLVGTMKLRKPQPRIGPCVSHFTFAVLWDGSVRMCGCRFARSERDDLVVGDIFSSTLLEISESQKTWDIVQDFMSGVKIPESCRSCTIYHPCNKAWVNDRSSKPIHQ